MCPVIDLLGSLSIGTFFSILQLWDEPPHETPLAPHFSAVISLMHEVLRTPHLVTAEAVKAAALSAKAVAKGKVTAGAADKDSSSLGIPPGYTAAAAAVKALSSVSHSIFRVLCNTYDVTRAVSAVRVMKLTEDSMYSVLLASAALHAARLHSKCSSAGSSRSRRQQQHMPQPHHVLVLDQLGMSWLLNEPGKLLLPAYMTQDLHAQKHVTPLQMMFRLRTTPGSLLSSGSNSGTGSQQLPGTAAPLFRAAADEEEDAEEASWGEEAGPKWFRPAALTPPAAEAEYTFSVLLVLLELLSLGLKTGPGAW
jgi:hypothetical protein